MRDHVGELSSQLSWSGRRGDVIEFRFANDFIHQHAELLNKKIFYCASRSFAIIFFLVFIQLCAVYFLLRHARCTLSPSRPDIHHYRPLKICIKLKVFPPGRTTVWTKACIKMQNGEKWNCNHAGWIISSRTIQCAVALSDHRTNVNYDYLVNSTMPFSSVSINSRSIKSFAYSSSHIAAPPAQS